MTRRTPAHCSIYWWWHCSTAANLRFIFPQLETLLFTLLMFKMLWRVKTIEEFIFVFLSTAVRGSFLVCTSGSIPLSLSLSLSLPTLLFLSLSTSTYLNGKRIDVHYCRTHCPYCSCISPSHLLCFCYGWSSLYRFFLWEYPQHKLSFSIEERSRKLRVPMVWTFVWEQSYSEVLTWRKILRTGNQLQYTGGQLLLRSPPRVFLYIDIIRYTQLSRSRRRIYNSYHGVWFWWAVKNQ